MVKTLHACMRTSRKKQITPGLRMPPALRYRGGIGKVGSKKSKRSAAMAVKTQRMREWLEDLLDNNTCKGLAWVNREEKKFQIMWTHASRHDFDTQEHADLFIRYAQLTGKTEIVEESKTGYNSKLKSNFRSALHSLVDCIKVEDATVGKSKGESPVRIYQFIDSSHPEYKRRRSLKITSQRNSKKAGTGKTKSGSDSAVKEETPMPIEECDTMDDTSSNVYHDGACEGGIILHDDANAADMFLLPDEAQEFLASNSNSNSNASISTDIQMIPPLSEAISYINPTTPITLSLCSNTDPLEPAAISTSHNTLSPDFQIDTSALEGDKAPTSTLPNFNELGVNDTFDSPVSHSNQLLNSGGSMRIRKDNREKTTYSILTNVELQQSQTETSHSTTTAEQPELRLYPVLGDGAPLTEIRTPSPQLHPTETDIGFPGDGSFGSIIEQSEAVTTVRHPPETISQGENYLFDISSFTAWKET